MEGLAGVMGEEVEECSWGVDNAVDVGFCVEGRLEGEEEREAEGDGAVDMAISKIKADDEMSAVMEMIS